jgi:hypothetical protein
VELTLKASGSKDIKLIDIDSVVPNPKNANRHSVEQIKRLEKLIKYQGFRNPLIISNRTGFLIVGHGRLEAAKNLGMEKLPVIYQDFENEAQEYAYLISDNEIARWAELDKQAVIEDMAEYDLDIELLGIEDFEDIDPLEADLPDLGDGSDPDIQQVTFTISNEQKDFLEEAMSKAASELDCTDEINKNTNGNKMAAIMRWYVNS